VGIPHATVVQLQQRGIDNVHNLVDFDKDTVEQIAADLRVLQEGHLSIQTLQQQQVLQFRRPLLCLVPNLNRG
jgi:hypothetical protein